MALGDNNTQCIYHADNSLHRNLFAGLVEYETLRQLHNKNNHMLGCLLISCNSAYYDLMPDRFIWTLDRKTTHTSLIEFIQISMERPPSKPAVIQRLEVMTGVAYSITMKGLGYVVVHAQI